MTKRVLIAYGSRYGTTEEVAQELGKMLEDTNIENVLVNIVATRPKDWPGIKSYDGILVGSGIKIGRWAKGPKRFLKHLEAQPDILKKTLGVFVCCGEALSKPLEAEKKYIGAIMEDLQIDADIQSAFGPVYDFSAESKMSGFAKKILLKALAEEGVSVDVNARNDLRDWARIRSFGEKFATMVKGM